VDFQAEPRRGGVGTSTGSDNASRGRLEALARIGVEDATRVDEGVGQAFIEGVATEAPRGLGEIMVMSGDAVAKPRDRSGGQGIGEVRGEGKAVDGLVVEGGDEFTANAMARVGTCFVHDNRNIGLAKPESESETREPSA